MSKRPGRSRLRYQQPTFGYDTQGVLFVNGICEDCGGEVQQKPKCLGIGYNLLSDTCFFTADGILKSKRSSRGSHEKAGFKTNMYFFVSFSNNGDEVVLRKSSEFAFDLEGYLAKTQKPALTNIMKADHHISNKSLHEAIEEYLIEYGYNRTFNKLVKSKKRKEEPWLVVKDSIRKSLVANDLTVAKMLILKNKQYVRDQHQLQRAICLLEVMYMMRKNKSVKEILDFMSKKMTKYKGETFELLDQQGNANEFQMKVGPVYQSISQQT